MTGLLRGVKFVGHPGQNPIRIPQRLVQVVKPDCRKGSAKRPRTNRKRRRQTVLLVPGRRKAHLVLAPTNKRAQHGPPVVGIDGNDLEVRPWMYSRVATPVGDNLLRRFLSDPLFPIASGNVEYPLGLGCGETGRPRKCVDGGNVAVKKLTSWRLWSGKKKRRRGRTGYRRQGTREIASPCSTGGDHWSRSERTSKTINTANEIGRRPRMTMLTDSSTSQTALSTTSPVNIVKDLLGAYLSTCERVSAGR